MRSEQDTEENSNGKSFCVVRNDKCDEVINHQNETLCPRSLVVCRSSFFRPHGVTVLAFQIYLLCCVIQSLFSVASPWDYRI